MSVACEQLEHPVTTTVTDIRTQLAEVTQSPLWSLRDSEVEALLRQAHAATAQLAQLQARITAEAHRRDLAGRAGAPGTPAWLRHQLRLSPTAAKHQHLLAIRLETTCPATAEALAEARITPDQAEVITRVIAELPAHLDPQLVASAEQRLLSEAASYDALLLARLGERILDVVDPDAAEARLGNQLAREEAA